MILFVVQPPFAHWDDRVFSNDARAVIFSWDATAHRSDKKNDLDYERLCFFMNCLKLGDGKCNTKNIQKLELRT